MAFLATDRVQETTTTAGSGPYVVSGAVPGFKSWLDGLGNGNSAYYAATDDVNWEVGETILSGGNTLARTTILASSNAGAAVVWGAGVKKIFLDYPATRSVFVTPAGVLNVNMTALQGTMAQFDGAATNGDFVWQLGNASLVNVAASSLYLSKTYGAGDSASAIRITLNGAVGGLYLSGYNGDAGVAHNTEFISGAGYTARSTEVSLYQQAGGNHSWWSKTGATVGAAVAMDKNAELTYAGDLSIRGNLTVPANINAASLSTSGPATVNGNFLIAGGAIVLQNNHNGGFLNFAYNNANTASRSWEMRNDWGAYGDFFFVTSATQTGVANVPRFSFNAGGDFFTYGVTLRTLVNGIGNIGLRASGPNNTGYIEFFKADGVRGAYLGNVLYPGGDIQYANEVGGGHSFNGTIYTPKLVATGARPITLSTGPGNVEIAGDTGGWGLGYFFRGSGGTFKGGFGALGGADNLSYYWIGLSENDPSFKVYPNGSVYAQAMEVHTNFTLKNPGNGGLRLQSAAAANTGYIEFLKPDNTRGAYIGFQEITANGVLRYNNELAGHHLFIGGPVDTPGLIIQDASTGSIVKDNITGSLNISGGTNLANGAALVLRGSNQASYGSRSEIWTSGLERQRCDPSGTTFIARSSDDLNAIVGSGNLRVGVDNTSTYAMCTSSGLAGMYAFQCVVQGAHVGGISCSTTATQYNTGSDERLKKNIHDAGDPGAMIDVIRVRQFDWKLDDHHQAWGVVAQEVHPIFPEAVSLPPPNSEGTERDVWGVDYSKFVPMLLKEIQLLRARVAALEAA